MDYTWFFPLRVSTLKSVFFSVSSFLLAFCLSIYFLHISGKEHAMADILWRARFNNKDGMVLEDEEVDMDFFEPARLREKRQSTPAQNEFDIDGYEG